MQVTRLSSFMTGSVSILMEGFFIEKMINTCKSRHIKLMCLNREKDTIAKAVVNVKDFRAITKIAKKYKCRIRIVKKSGIPFVMRKYRKRKFFVFALLTVIVFILIISRFVWNIEIVGANNISESEILELVKTEGIEIGKLKENIKPVEVVEKIRISRPDISWVGIKISGTNVRIEVVEADAAPKVIDANEYCNIVSTKDALVEKICAQNGTLQVKSGDVVKKGTVLIAGWLEGKYTGTRYVHSSGDVIGKVWYTEKARAYYKQIQKNQTGNIEKKYAVKVNNFPINFFKRLSKFEIYDTIRSEKKLKISSNFYLPIEVIKCTNYELKEEEKEYSKDDAKEQAVNEAKAKLMQQIRSEEDIVNEYINTDETDEYIDVEVTYEVRENIGTEEKIAL